MAITKMKRLELVGLNSERKRLIEYIQRLGAVDLSDSREEGLSARETASAISQFESDMAQTAAALEILAPYGVKKGGMFYQRPEIDADKVGLGDSEISEMTALTSEVLRTKKAAEDAKEKIAVLTQEERMLMPYIRLDVPLGLKRTGNAVVRVGTLEGEWTKERLWQEFLAAELKSFYFEVLSATKNQTAVWIICHAEQEKALDAMLTKLNFVRLSVDMTDKIPSEELSQIRKNISELESESKRLENRLSELSGRREKLELFYDKITLRRDKYKALSQIGITENAFFVTGYVPEKLAEGIKADITKNFTAAVELFEPDKDEDVPRAFENNGFIEPVEGITSDYAMPSSHDVDPNPIMAFFYYFFFGMMFSDAGYGLLMMIACGLLGYGNFLEKGKRRAYKMFFFCGVSTTFWGLMYGSFFGDMIATVSKTFGNGTLALKPILMDPVQKPLDLLIMSVAFGLVHMLTALAVKFYMTWRSGERLAAVFDTGFWFTLLSGIGIFAAGMGLGISVLQTVGLVMMIGSAAGLILTQGRDKKNPIMKVFGGILSLYDITSYVGDALSYSRLMALGLATGVIASVINVLGSLGGGSVVGLIAFILISVFGHSLNFAINMLGAYVHTNRLQYVEFYQKFYEGGGRKYKPFGFNTKYYLFKNKT